MFYFLDTDSYKMWRKIFSLALILRHLPTCQLSTWKKPHLLPCKKAVLSLLQPLEHFVLVRKTKLHRNHVIPCEARTDLGLWPWKRAEFQNMGAGLWSEPGVHQGALGTWILVLWCLTAAEALYEWEWLGHVCERKVRRNVWLWRSTPNVQSTSWRVGVVVTGPLLVAAFLFGFLCVMHLGNPLREVCLWSHELKPYC